MLIARPLVSRVDGTRLRSVSIAFFVAAAVALVATPVYVDIATAKFALRSAFAVGTLVPLMRVSVVRPRPPRPRALLRAVHRRRRRSRSGSTGPTGPRRSIAELLSLSGALAAAAAILVLPGLAGHAAQTSPRGCVAALRLAPPARRLDLDRRARRAARALGGAAVGAPGGRTRRLRPALLERRLRLGADPDRLGSRRPRCSTCRRSARSGRPRTARPSSSRSGCC